MDSIRTLDLLLNVAIGYLGIMAEKVETSVTVSDVVVASKRLYGLASSFKLYALSDGLAEIFSKGFTGMRAFFKRPNKILDNGQMRLFEWAS
jgi:hypothetical protein